MTEKSRAVDETSLRRAIGKAAGSDSSAYQRRRGSRRVAQTAALIWLRG